jgi:predicted transcriptional regulator
MKSVEVFWQEMAQDSVGTDFLRVKLTDGPIGLGLGRRSKMESLIEVLSVVAEGAERPTRIMYRANLSWRALSHCLDTLVRKNLLARVTYEDKINYNLTEKGYKVLNLYMKLANDLRG